MADAEDLEIGSVSDLVLDVETLTIEYLALDTGGTHFIDQLGFAISLRAKQVVFWSSVPRRIRESI